MVAYIGLIVAVCVLSFSQIYAWSKFYDEKINFKKLSFYISLILMTACGILGAIFINAYIKMIMVAFVFCFCNYIIFHKKMHEVAISTLLGHLVLSICDAIGAAFLILLFGKDAVYVKNEFFVTFVGNFLVAILFLIIIKFKIFKKIYSKMVSLTNKMKFKNLIFAFLLFIISINFSMAVIYYQIKSIYAIVVNTLLVLVYSFIVYRSLNEKNINMIIKAENTSLMESLNEYENMVDRQRVDNHENKNQLLIIKNMIKKDDKSVIKYIDTIVKDEKEDDEALYTRVKTIPSGGLQGIIYQKMLSMKDEKILYSLDVSRDVRKVNLDNLSMSDNYKLCKIIGVLLDNAIEASKKLKDGCIMISLYLDEEMLVVDISNRFEGNIDIEKLDSKGYTTKGDGHGYGLSLVKKILSESDIFVNERRVKNDIFKQTIKVKINKKS